MSNLKKALKKQSIDLEDLGSSRRVKNERDRIRDMSVRYLQSVGIYFEEEEICEEIVSVFKGIELHAPESDEEKVPKPKLRVGKFEGYSDFTKYDYPKPLEWELDI
jgi:hypothetical protein